MPPTALDTRLHASQPALRQRPKSPNRVLAEAEEQWIFEEDELSRTPSAQDGMSLEKEKELRAKGINFIRQVGIMLKLPELTLSTAAIFFNRYLMRMSLVDRPGMKALHHYVSEIPAMVHITHHLTYIPISDRPPESHQVRAFPLLTSTDARRHMPIPCHES